MGEQLGEQPSGHGHRVHEPLPLHPAGDDFSCFGVSKVIVPKRENGF